MKKHYHKKKADVEGEKVKEKERKEIYGLVLIVFGEKSFFGQDPQWTCLACCCHGR